MKTFDKQSREYKLLESPWKPYLKKYDDLDKIHTRYNWHYMDSLTQEQIVMQEISPNTTLENSYNRMQDFFTALEDNDSQKLKRIICSKEPVGGLMHKTLLTFKHILKAILNGAQSSYSNGCLEGFNLNLSIRKKVDKNIVMFLSTFIL